jgi:hypothetical protein
MIAALMGNEMTAPLGTQMQFQDIQNRQETERLLAVERAKQAGKPPTIHEFYDGQGRTGMSQWNARTQSWEPVGGVKADAPRNVQTITTDAGVFVLNPDGSTGRRLGGAPQSQARETWSAPVPVMIDGKPAMVQYSNTGNYRVVPDAAPYDAPGTAAKTPEQIREEAKARAQGTAEGTPEQARETWNAPVNETRNGKPVRVQYSNMGNYRVVPDAAPYDAPGTAAKTPDQIRAEAQARAEGAAAGTRERFTVNVGSNEVTYTGDPTDQSTWQKVGEAPRFPPSQNRNVQTVTTGNGVFVVNPDGSLGQRLGDAPGATAKTPDQIREEAMARAQGTAAGTPPKPQTPLEVLEARLGQMALDGELNTPEGKAALLNYQLFNGGKTLDQMRDEARVQAEGRAMGAAPVEQIREEAKARAEGAAAGTPPKPQTPLEVLEARLGQMALDGTLDSREGQETLAAYRRVKGEKTADQLRDEAQASAEGRSAAETGQREFEIKRYMLEYGVSRDVAQGVVDGVVKLTDNQQTGLLTITNAVTGESRVVQPSFPDVGRGPLARVATSTYDLPEIGPLYNGGAVGPEAAAAYAWNRTIALADKEGLTVKRQEAAIRQLAFVRESIVEAMLKSDRGAINEQNRLLGLLPTPGGFWSNDKVAAENLTEVYKILARRRDRYASELQSPSLTRETREEADRAIRRIDGVLYELGMPPEVARANGLIPEAGSTNTAPAPEGIDAAVWGKLTPEERALWQN